jgi:hypothetical protein
MNETMYENIQFEKSETLNNISYFDTGSFTFKNFDETIKNLNEITSNLTVDGKTYSIIYSRNNVSEFSMNEDPYDKTQGTTREELNDLHNELKPLIKTFEHLLKVQEELIELVNQFTHTIKIDLIDYSETIYQQVEQLFVTQNLFHKMEKNLNETKLISFNSITLNMDKEILSLVNYLENVNKNAVCGFIGDNYDDINFGVCTLGFISEFGNIAIILTLLILLFIVYVLSLTGSKIYSADNETSDYRVNLLENDLHEKFYGSSQRGTESVDENSW